MSALNLLRSCGYQSKPYIGFAKLSHGNHEIKRFRFVTNKLYNPESVKSLKPILLVELADQVLFLPEYFAVNLNNDDKKVYELNSDGVKKFLYFGGARPNRLIQAMIKKCIF